MKKTDLKLYQNNAIDRFKQILAEKERGSCDEQGLPAYTNPNPLMRWLTWKRVEIILLAIESIDSINNVLDFGCGYGVFLPYLSMHAKDTIAFDKIANQTKMVGERFGWSNITFEDDFSKIESRKATFNLILAIEVLEHIENLDETLGSLSELLTDSGHLLVAGPTENFLYQAGRKIAGYSGEYHVRNIFEIKEALYKDFTVKKIATILPLLPFYEVYDCERK